MSYRKLIKHAVLNVKGNFLITEHSCILGSQFNKDGEKRTPWMSNFSLTEFHKRSKCLVEQYSNYYSDLGNGKKIKVYASLLNRDAGAGGLGGLEHPPLQ